MLELHVLPAGKVGHQSRDDFVVAVRLGFSLNVFLKVKFIICIGIIVEIWFEESALIITCMLKISKVGNNLFFCTL